MLLDATLRQQLPLSFLGNVIHNLSFCRPAEEPTSKGMPNSFYTPNMLRESVIFS